MSNSTRENVPHARIRRLKKDDIRARLLQSAAAVFSDKGFEKTTLEEIAENAGFSKGAVYSNFENKDELFFSLIERQIDERIRKVETILTGESGAGADMKKTGASLIAISRDEPEWQILFIEYWLRAVRNPKLLERFVGRRRQMRDKIARLLERSMETNPGTFPMPASSYALLILALSNGLGIESIIDPETVSTDVSIQLFSLLFADPRPKHAP